MCKYNRSVVLEIYGGGLCSAVDVVDVAVGTAEMVMMIEKTDGSHDDER